MGGLRVVNAAFGGGGVVGNWSKGPEGGKEAGDLFIHFKSWVNGSGRNIYYM